MRCLFLIAALLSPLSLTAEAVGQKLLVADFEGDTYGDWTVEGDAFGSGPAAGTLAGQMNVDGYQGERLVNSYHGGDDATGTLTSPPLEIRRDYIALLIGGGGFDGKTCVNLLHQGSVVRTAVGPNTNPGGSEELTLQYWDVRQLKGETVSIQIVDQATGGWGHVNVDHIVQTDVKPDVPTYQPLAKSFEVDRRYLVIPIRDDAEPVELTLTVDGRPVRRYDAPLAANPAEVDWYAFFTIDAYRGQQATVAVSRGVEETFSLIRQTDEVPGSDSWYDEPLRPQFHFSQAVGWNNDPNGMVYLDGEWHLFFQHNPVGWNWGNMTWGHAVSEDLVHWRQLPNVLFPETMAVGACFSGGGNVDRQNTAGWKTGANDVLVVFLTDTEAGESVAYSNDRGRTFTWYEDNAVVKHQGRDPKVIWYAYDQDDRPLDDRARRLGGHWVMAVYDEHEKFGKNIAFYTSVDLKQWKEQSHLPGYYECPELFELPVDGDATDARWVVFAADAKYMLGDFDGRTFTPGLEQKRQVHWGQYYASQTFENAPDRRRIQIGWVQIPTPGMPFNQTFSFPHRLTLRTTGDGVRMHAQPIDEIELLHQDRCSLPAQPLRAGAPATLDVNAELLDVRAAFELGDAKHVALNVGGNRFAYDAEQGVLGDVPLEPIDGQITLQILLDRPMIEICGNDGRVYITQERKHRGQVDTIEAVAEGGDARLIQLDAFQLRSIWSDWPQQDRQVR